MKAPLFWSLALHALSRVWLPLTGIRFDDSSLPYFWQFVDPELLRSDLWRSLFFLHSQPPAFNAFLGVALAIAPDHITAFFRYAYIGLGLVLHVALYALLRRCGAGPRLAAATALLFMLSPPALLYENWLFYTYPLTVGICLVTVFAHRYLTGHRVADGVALFGIVGMLAMTRSLLHLVWCVVILLIVLAAGPSELRRRTAAVAAVPLFLVLALYAKNAILFGQFGPSSWLGLNLAKLTVDARAIDPDEREALIRDGTLTPFVRIDTYSPLDRYPAEFTAAASADVPVLTQRMKPSEVPNYNHAAYVEISRQYSREAVALIRARPDIYLRSVGRAFAIYALPVTDFWTLNQNRSAIARWDTFWSRSLNGAWGPWLARNPLPADSSDPYNPRTLDYAIQHAAYGWLAVLLFSLIVSLTRGVRGLRDGAADRAHAGMSLVIAFTIVFVTMVGNLLELGENNRYRFMFDPLVWAVTVGVLARRGGSAQGAAAIDHVASTGDGQKT